MKKNCAEFLVVVLIVTLFAGCVGGGSTTLSSAKAITVFSITSPAATGTIDQSAMTILVNVPSGTNVTALMATFTTTGQSVMVGNTLQVSEVTPNNFTNPVIYTVTAADGSTQNYLVTVVAGALPAQWAQTATVENSDSFLNSVSVASDGSVYVSGYIYGTGTYNFGNSVTAIGTSNLSNIVLVKYNSSGVAQWAQTVTVGSDSSQFYSVSVASDGSVYAAGLISGTGTYNFGNNVTAIGTSGGVLVKYNSSGVAQWAQTATGRNCGSFFNSVSVASDGSVYAAGNLYGTVTCNFGNSITATAPYGNSNIVLVKYNSSGVAQWAQTVTAGSDVSYFNSVSVASDGSVYAAGNIGSGTYIFGNSVTATGTAVPQFTGNLGLIPANIILVKYSSYGVAQWAQTVTAGKDISYFTSVSLASDGSVYAAGSILGTGILDFGNSVTAAGTNSNTSTPFSYNLVLVKYNSNGVAQWAQTVTEGSGNSYFKSVSVASDGSVYAAGSISGTDTYNFGNSVTAAGTFSTLFNFNIVLVKYNSSGVAQWAQTVTAGTDISSFFNSISVASDGSVYAAGNLYGPGTCNFGNGVSAAGTSSVGSNYNIVLVKYY